VGPGLDPERRTDNCDRAVYVFYVASQVGDTFTLALFDRIAPPSKRQAAVAAA
jgi:hypothetical protein